MTTGPFRSAIQRDAVLFARAHRDLQQFGQQHDDDVWQGQTACTHCCLQFIEYFVHGRKLTLNEVNHFAGMPRNANVAGVPRGMRPAEIVTFIKATNLPYRLVTGRDWTEARTAALLGPVMYSMRMGSEPSWKGTVYHGIHAKAPFAKWAGRTQLTGDDVRHAMLFLGEKPVRDSHGGLTYWRTYVKDSNHGSPARPERPPHDIITGGQARASYEAYRTKLHQTPWLLLPVRKVR